MLSQDWTTYCDGKTSDCAGEKILGEMTLEEDCQPGAMCRPGEGEKLHGKEIEEVLVCAIAPCCEEDGQFRGSDFLCESWTEYQCLEFCGGANRMVRDLAQYCPGDSGFCAGSVTDPAWVPMSECESDEACWQDNFGRPLCSKCGDSDICEEGSCVCEFETCLDGCCDQGQICRWNNNCGFGESKLTASDAQAHDWFGSSVSISGDVAIVGAPEEDGGYRNPIERAGAAYIFQLVNGQWVEKKKLTASDARVDDHFGGSVSISGDVALVAAAGAAYIFRLENLQWVEKQKLMASDAQAGDYFGGPVSISGDVAIVGSPFEDGDEGDSMDKAGAAYIFLLENGEWKRKQKLTASDAQSGDYFGRSVSISGDSAIVGAWGSGDSWSGSEAAYIFQLVNGEWVEKKKFNATDAQDHDWFGASVSISGEVAIVGAPFRDVGVAYIFALENEEWIEKQKLTASDAQIDDMFGYSVSISGDTTIVGAISEDGANSMINTGAAYIFQLENGEWVEKKKLTASDSQIAGNFGTSVSISGDVVIVGAVGDDFYSIIATEAAYIY